MERKRKLPPRAAARAEQLAKRRSAATRDKSKTPPPPPSPEPVVKDPTPTPPPPPLPTSIEPGKPLPTIETAQAGNLSPEDYQSISERYVQPVASAMPDKRADPDRQILTRILSLAACSPSLSLDPGSDGSAKACSKSTGRSRTRKRAFSSRTPKTLPKIP